MPLINFTKEELYKIMECINGDADSYGDKICEGILDKIENLDDLFYDHTFVSIREEETEPVNYYQGA